jgi:glutaminyl-tRNA synthetase
VGSGGNRVWTCFTRPDARSASRNFLEQIIDADLASGRVKHVHTRFPPEPNGYLHLGHAKSICLNFGLAQAFGGKFNLRFDDTNPSKEDQEYVDAIIRDVKWLGADFTGPHGGGLHYASNLFPLMYSFAEELIQKNLAYVCTLSADEVAARRGSIGVPATSPHRDRPVAESLALLREMKAKKHPNGAMTLRAKIDLASPNFNLRDPVLYRILHESHQHTKDTWCIYPMYDWAHGFEDSAEGITHSICTLEFEDHRPLYHWFIDAVNKDRGDTSPWGKPIHHPQQIEFAKLRPTFTVLSKRNLLKMVEENIVSGWDDPRMPTIAGIRRRGYTPAAIRAFCEDIGVTKVESSIDIARLENALRDDLNTSAPRRMAVLRPLKLVIDNYPADRDEALPAVNNPERPSDGSRLLPFSREILIEHDDFMESPAPGFHRLSVGSEVRLRWAYCITAHSVVKDAAGLITHVHCTFDPATKGGDIPAGPDGKPIRKVQSTLHWVSSPHALPLEVRLYDRLFTAETPGERTGDWRDDLNPRALEVVRALGEPALADCRYHPESDAGPAHGDTVQFERLGYFTLDPDSRSSPVPVFNRTVTLKDSAPAQGKKPGASINTRTYSLTEAAHDLKIKQARLEAALALAAPAIPSLAEVPARTPTHLTLMEVRALKDWFKVNAKLVP